MQGLNRLETAKLLVNSFYEETPLETSLLDTVESANDKILKDFGIAKKMAFKCADFLEKEHTHNHPISWNIKRQLFYREVKSTIENLTMGQTFKKAKPVNLDFRDTVCEGCGNYNMQCTCYEKSKDDHFNSLR